MASRRSPKEIDMTGRRIGRWTVLQRSEKRDAKGRSWWLCRCDCGRERDIIGYSLRGGTSKSCGCLSAEVTSRILKERCTTHGMTGSPEWNSWSSMLDRCFNQESQNYPDYGGAGVSVCDRWRFDFQEFYSDMGPRPAGTTIDRIDGLGHYCPANCRWATAEQQNRNRRIVRWLEYGGRRMTIKDWAVETGLTAQAIYQRLNYGWPIERVLTEPLAVRNRLVAEAPHLFGDFHNGPNGGLVTEHRKV